jgi:hypothetical protein
LAPTLKSVSKGTKSVNSLFTRLPASKVELPEPVALFDVTETMVGNVC